MFACICLNTSCISAMHVSHTPVCSTAAMQPCHQCPRYDVYVEEFLLVKQVTDGSGTFVSSYVPRVSRCCFLHESFCFLQWRQADSIRHLGKVTLAQEQDYTGLIVGCMCVSLLLMLLGTLLLWKKNKHIDGKSRATGSRMLSHLK